MCHNVGQELDESLVLITQGCDLSGPQSHSVWLDSRKMERTNLKEEYGQKDCINQRRSKGSFLLGWEMI